MTLNGWIQIAIYCAIVLLLVRPLGGYMTRVFAGERTVLSPVLRPVERLFYAAAGVREDREQHWTGYAFGMLIFSLVGVVLLYAMQRFQDVLPLNPAGMSAVPEGLAFNTAVSFVTNTNWQSYGGESTMGYLVQMAGLTVQNFVSAATGIALAIALVRGFARRSAQTIGNFWVDLTRATLYVLLPICVVATIFFVWQGVPQNFGTYVDATTLEGAHQTIAQGPVASQLAIKMLGTNGGGFFNANSAHPYENPTALSNLVQMVLIFAIGAALTNTFGRMVGNEKPGLGDPQRHGRAVPRRRLHHLLAGGGRRASAGLARRRPQPRQHGGQGGPLRRGFVGPVRGDHHGGVLRRHHRPA